MTTLQSPANPFALLLDPQTVLDRVEHSDRLERLQRRICRPLDKPIIPAVGVAADRGEFDRCIDALPDEPEDDDAAAAH